jgi:intein/homing endonuclease
MGHHARQKRVDFGFLGKWSHDMAYVLGLFFADGCVTGRSGIDIVSADSDILRFVQTRVCPTISIKECVTTGGSFYWRLKFKSVDTVRILAGYGITPRKTKTMPWPEIPARFVADFIRGFLDGDGSIDKTGRIRFTSTSVRFIDGLAAALIAWSLAPTVKHPTIYLNTPDSIALASLIYVPHRFAGRRKFARARLKR